MPHDQEMQAVLESLLSSLEGMTSKRMFGGMCYLDRGNMALGIHRDRLIVRLGSAEAATPFLEAGEAIPFDITGRPMKGWVMVPKSQLADASAYRRWVDRALAFTATLPPK
jgi:TfoX/Sxy family transcriptional regulator of competence genes